MPLNPKEVEHIQKAFKNDQELVLHVGMTPGKLADLIAYNSNVASDLLLCMTHTSYMDQYYEALLDVKTTSNSLEVFAKVSNGVELPHEYITLFVTKKMEECKNHAQRTVQQRMVRIVSLFLHNSIKAKTINFNTNINIEIERFCMEFC